MDKENSGFCGEESALGEAEVDMRYLPEYRGEFMRLFGASCVYCQSALDLEPRQSGRTRSKTPVVDHIVPRSKGGTHAPANLTLACYGCNCSKSDSSILEFQLKRGFAIGPVRTFEGLSTEGFEDRRVRRIRSSPRASQVVISAGFTADEKKRLLESAQREGFSLAAWMRWELRKAAAQAGVTNRGT